MPKNNKIHSTLFIEFILPFMIISNLNKIDMALTHVINFYFFLKSNNLFFKNNFKYNNKYSLLKTKKKIENLPNLNSTQISRRSCFFFITFI